MSSIDTLTALQQYYDFIERHRNDVFADGDQYDMHHIQPKSLGGKDDESNLIKLSPRNHLIAHRMIVKCCEQGTQERKIAAYTAYKMGKVKRYK